MAAATLVATAAAPVVPSEGASTCSTTVWTGLLSKVPATDMTARVTATPSSREAAATVQTRGTPTVATRSGSGAGASARRAAPISDGWRHRRSSGWRGGTNPSSSSGSSGNGMSAQSSHGPRGPGRAPHYDGGL